MPYQMKPTCVVREPLFDSLALAFAGRSPRGAWKNDITLCCAPPLNR